MTSNLMTDEGRQDEILTVPKKFKPYKPKYHHLKNVNTSTDDEKVALTGGYPSQGNIVVKDQALAEFIIKYKLQQLSDVLVSEGITCEFLMSQSEQEINEISKELTPFKIQQNKFKFAVQQLQKENNGPECVLDFTSSAAETCSEIAIDRKSESIKRKFGSNKTVTTWCYNGADGKQHCVEFSHGVKEDKNGKSKRKIVVDGKQRYVKKSNDIHFVVNDLADRLRIAIEYNTNHMAMYELFINEEAFSALQIDKSSSFSL
eukprot:CAMPEP_0202726622 /NCGR_PEP_ID=MMETSP1385-20130828/184706_1 /ASSEMBLY_ACC=CAM_ASM_000861 /TAXON_ID=933848 /ORGANISM="Elphidium margaritaceum" /LENGTH=259 /DNA_ID=CAMNT_0049392845 /DNA_START=108 /DNA_END=887 /DNA_ORIENTATION=-